MAKIPSSLKKYEKVKVDVKRTELDIKLLLKLLTLIVQDVHSALTCSTMTH